MITVIALCLQLVLVTAVPVSAQSSGNTGEEVQKMAVYEEMDSNTGMDSIMSNISFEEIDNVLDDILEHNELGFQDIIQGLIQGDFDFSEEYEGGIREFIIEEISFNKKDMTYLLILAVSASVFSVFTEVLKDKQIADTWFYMLYLMMCVVVFGAFKEIMECALSASKDLVSFIEVLVPAYSLSVSLATGPCTGAGFYQCTLILISLISNVVNVLIIPMTQAFVIVKIINYISEEDILSRMAGLFESGVKWMLKTSMTVLVGFQVIQSLLAPAIDSLKNTSVSRALSAIPGIGGAAGAVTEMLVGSAVLVKNGIGTAAIIVILIICLPPLIKIAVFTISYKVLAAVVQPVTDKRFTGCMAAAADGGALVLKSCSMIAAMFMLSIAIVGLTK